MRKAIDYDDLLESYQCESAQDRCEPPPLTGKLRHLVLQEFTVSSFFSWFGVTWQGGFSWEE